MIRQENFMAPENPDGGDPENRSEAELSALTPGKRQAIGKPKPSPGRLPLLRAVWACLAMFAPWFLVGVAIGMLYDYLALR